VVLSVCQSCGEKRSEGYLASHYEELIKQTVPLDAANVTRTAVKHAEWSDSGSWEFETKETVPQYTGWLTEKLKDDFEIVKSEIDSMVFAKNVKGDTESVIVHLNTSAGHLHVRVEVSIRPD
jgi:hypothetical protein